MMTRKNNFARRPATLLKKRLWHRAPHALNDTGALGTGSTFQIFVKSLPYLLFFLLQPFLLAVLL